MFDLVVADNLTIYDPPHALALSRAVCFIYCILGFHNSQVKSRLFLVPSEVFLMSQT